MCSEWYSFSSDKKRVKNDDHRVRKSTFRVATLSRVHWTSMQDVRWHRERTTRIWSRTSVRWVTFGLGWCRNATTVFAFGDIQWKCNCSSPVAVDVIRQGMWSELVRCRLAWPRTVTHITRRKDFTPTSNNQFDSIEGMKVRSNVDPSRCEDQIIDVLLFSRLDWSSSQHLTNNSSWSALALTTAARTRRLKHLERLLRRHQLQFFFSVLNTDDIHFITSTDSRQFNDRANSLDHSKQKKFHGRDQMLDEREKEKEKEKEMKLFHKNQLLRRKAQLGIFVFYLDQKISCWEMIAVFMDLTRRDRRSWMLSGKGCHPHLVPLIYHRCVSIAQVQREMWARIHAVRLEDNLRLPEQQPEREERSAFLSFRLAERRSKVKIDVDTMHEQNECMSSRPNQPRKSHKNERGCVDETIWRVTGESGHFRPKSVHWADG